jgi:flagellar biosynthesis protein FlgN
MNDATPSNVAAPAGALTHSSLYATLVDEQSAVEAFASLLACEEQALCGVNPLDTLAAIIDDKTGWINRLTQLERARDAHLEALGLPAGRKGMDAAIASDAGLARQWSLLQQSAERARVRNATIGVLIRVRMDYNRRALDALRAVPSKQDFYGPDGRLAAAG